MKTRQEYNDYMKTYMLKRYYKRKRAAIRQLGGICVKCGSKKRLQFDHVERFSREFVMGRVLTSGSEETLQKELKKCQLLCLICHQDKTFLELGRKRAKGFHGTVSTYTYCHCELCKTAKRECQRAWRTRKKLEEKK